MDRVSEWTRNIEDLLLEEGDLIEFDRGIYCHWAIYVGDGKIIHFNPTGTEEKVKFHRMSEFIPGLVTRDSLTEVAGDSLLRINNKPHLKQERRSVEEMSQILEDLLESEGFYYCLKHFNCEHFVTFVKFNYCHSLQIDTFSFVWQRILPYFFTVWLSFFDHKEYYHKMAYMQWSENWRASKLMESPNFFLNKVVRFKNAISWRWNNERN